MTTEKDIKRFQKKALEDRLEHETIEVTMTKTGLKFKIDSREAENWRLRLTKTGDPFTMKSLDTGDQVSATAKTMRFEVRKVNREK